MGLPAVVEELLVEVVADGFVLYCCGPQAAPGALVACYEWGRYVDLLTVRDFDRVITARVPTQGHTVDIFAPEVVVWAYEGPPQQALRALLELVHPAHPDAPITEYPAPAGLCVPRVQQRPMTIQLPAPGRAGVQAAWLAIARTTPGGARSTSVAGLIAAPDPRLAAGGGSDPDAGLAAASRPPTTPREVRHTMTASSSRPAQDRWCDIEGTCSRLHRPGGY